MSDQHIYQSEARASLEREQRPQPRNAAPQKERAVIAQNRLHRRRRTEDPLAIDPRIVPPGQAYEWKRDMVMGQPDKSHWIGLRENHWTPVPAERHPELAFIGDTQIRRGDVVLCERPRYLTEEAQDEDVREALGPVQNMEDIMYGPRPGELPRDHPSVKKIANINRQFSPGDPIESRGSAEP